MILFGTVLQLAGTLVTAWGLARTWREFAAEGFWDEPKRRLRVAAAEVRTRAIAVMDRLRGRRRVAVGSNLAFGGALAFNARGRIGFAPMPKSTKAALFELENRTLTLLANLTTTQERVQEVGDEVQRLGGTLKAEVGRLEGSARKVAVGGLRVAAFGLGLVALGLAFQVIALAIAG
jgi:hypothetical protein